MRWSKKTVDLKKVTWSANPSTQEDEADAEYSEHYLPPIADPRNSELYRREIVHFCTDFKLRKEMARLADCQTSEIYDIGQMCQQATLVLWSMELWNTACKGSEIFLDQNFEEDMLYPQTQMWVPDRDMYLQPEVQEALDTKGRDTLWAVLLHTYKGNLMTFPFFIKKMQTKEEVAEFNADPRRGVPFVIPMPVLAGCKPIFRWQADYLAMMNFMNLEVVVNEQYVHPRPERRRAQKANVQLPDIRVIKLRKTYHASIPGEAKSDFEYSCHWLVRGHWRWQWYPSTQNHAPKFVVPCVKGDLDKPFKAPTETIYAVVR